jgi:hypothetical protein
MRGEWVIHIPDIRESETYGEYPEYRRLIELGGIHTLLIVPLRKDKALLGAITAYLQEVRCARLPPMDTLRSLRRSLARAVQSRCSPPSSGCCAENAWFTFPTRHCWKQMLR